MRRKLVVTAAVAAVALGSVVAVSLLVAPAGATAGGRAGTPPHGWGVPQRAGSSAGRLTSRTLQFKATTLKLRSIDVDGDGRDDAGDYVIFTESLVGRGDTTAKGTDSVRCTLNSAGPGRKISMCDGEFILPGLGQITVYGTASPWVAVTGGTGSFDGARGQAKVVSISRDSELITITLLS
jgi:hypothetical protein